MRIRSSAVGTLVLAVWLLHPGVARASLFGEENGPLTALVAQGVLVLQTTLPVPLSVGCRRGFPLVVLLDAVAPVSTHEDAPVRPLYWTSSYLSQPVTWLASACDPSSCDRRRSAAVNSSSASR